MNRWCALCVLVAAALIMPATGTFAQDSTHLTLSDAGSPTIRPARLRLARGGCDDCGSTAVCGCAPSACGCDTPCGCDAPAQPVADSCGCGAPTGCDDACDSCDSCGNCCSCFLFGGDEAWEVMPGDNCYGIKIGGWLQAGYHDQQTPLSVSRGDLLAFNDVPDSFNLHQAWMYIEREADGSDCCLDWGFRADIVYGTDAQKTQAFGGNGWDNDWDHGVYGWALPQAYGELAYGNLSVIGGHFYTLIGYEVVPAPDNFFYSHSLTMFNSEPFTHTGVLATYGVSDNLEVYGGWTAGWDTGFEAISEGSNFLGGFSASIWDDVTLTYITTFGDFGSRGDDAYSHSVVLDVALTDRLNYVFQSDLLSIAETGEDDIGINQYLLFAYNDCWSFGGRVEWWRDESVSNYEATAGINYRPHANVVFRPEARYDWVPETNFDETTFGVDAIVTF